MITRSESTADPHMPGLQPEPPFLWPEPRVLVGHHTYLNRTAVEQLCASAEAMFGLVTALTESGIALLESTFDSNPSLRCRLVISVYPTCRTGEHDLERLREMVRAHDSRLDARVRPYPSVTDRPTNAFCLKKPGGDTFIAIGPSENLGLDHAPEGKIDFVFRAEASLVETFRRYFDWLWANSAELDSTRVIQIPALVLPEGTAAAQEAWDRYLAACAAATGIEVQQHATVDPDTGEVVVEESATETIGIEKLDPFTDEVARIYDRGSLVSIDKYGRTPPLDAPLNPAWFGDEAETHRGAITRKVTMRVSIIDEGTLKEIEKRRKGIRNLLNRFSLALADNMRWMPSAAQPLFEAELHRLNEEGRGLLEKLFHGDVAAFVSGKRDAVRHDLEAMGKELGRDVARENVIDQVMNRFKERLSSAATGSLLPSVTYSAITFKPTASNNSSPWGQAYTLLHDLARFPRRAITDPFFFRGLRVNEEDLLDAMNVADDALHVESRATKVRCMEELELLDRIHELDGDAMRRCRLVFQVIRGRAEQARADLGEKDGQ